MSQHSPLFQNFSGLPPLLFLAGGAEPLLDDSLRAVEAAKAAGVDATAHVQPYSRHAFPLHGPDVYEAAISSFARRVLKLA